MLTKINIYKIITDHIRTLKNFQTNKISISDIIVFYGVPLSVVIVLNLYGFKLKGEFIEILITSFSIFTALLFNLLLLLFDIVRKNVNKEGSTNNKLFNLQKLKTDLLKQVYSNISYSIFISILTLIFLLTTQISFGDLFNNIVEMIIYFLCLNFILTLFLILKRIHTLLSNEF